MDELMINGMSDEQAEAFYGELGRVPASQKARMIRQVMAKGNPAAPAPVGRGTSRQEFEKRMHLLSPEIQKSLVTGSKRLADVSLYTTKLIGGKMNIKMLTDDDKKVIGVNNISSGKLEKENVLLLQKIILVAGVGNGNVNPFDVAFDIIPKEVRNGEFYFRANDSEIIPPSTLEMFDTTNMECKRGQFTLDNPVLLHTQKAMEFYAEWGSAAVANTWMRLVLVGSMVVNK